MNDSKAVENLVAQKADKTIKLAKDIWEYAELNFREVKSAGALCEALSSEGFNVSPSIYGIKTAFVAEFTHKSGDIIIGFLGEYDALSGLSQKAGFAEKCAVIEDGDGHGCGHNLLGAGSFAAAVALKEYIVQNDISATVKYFGCPAEEDGGGKTHMAKHGAFNGLDAAFTWHPGEANYVVGTSSLAVNGVLYKFKGVSSHAAATPHVGRSALDAAELMSVGCNYLREHIIPEARIHYAYRDVGGKAPNVVQASASVHYYIRAPHVSQMFDIAKRVADVAKGAALMTGTELEIQEIDGVSDYVPNGVLSSLLADSMSEVGAPLFDDNDYALAQKFSDTISEKEREENLERVYSYVNQNKNTFDGKNLDNNVWPLVYMPNFAEPGSTDVGDVSYCVPTAQCTYACMALGTGGHSWQMTAQANSSIAMKGMLKAAEAMCLAAIKTLKNPEIITSAKQELKNFCKDGYVCPMPDGVNPEF